MCFGSHLRFHNVPPHLFFGSTQEGFLFCIFFVGYSSALSVLSAIRVMTAAASALLMESDGWNFPSSLPVRMPAR